MNDDVKKEMEEKVETTSDDRKYADIEWDKKEDIEERLESSDTTEEMVKHFKEDMKKAELPESVDVASDALLNFKIFQYRMDINAQKVANLELQKELLEHSKKQIFEDLEKYKEKLAKDAGVSYEDYNLDLQSLKFIKK